MPSIIIRHQGTTIECKKGTILMDALRDSGIVPESPCGGKGICKKCKVRVLNGPKAGVVLSCRQVVSNDMEIELLDGKGDFSVLKSGYVPEFDFDNEAIANVDDDDNCIYGAAVDLGTTTIVCSVINMLTGEELASTSSINPQRKNGHDILSRIAYEMEYGPAGVKRLQDEVVVCINRLIDTACLQASVDKKKMREIVISANPTMMHMLLGEEAISLGRYPYEPAFTESKTIPATKLDIVAGDNTKVYTLPLVSAFIGADIVSGAYVCGLNEKNKNTLFLDIGTNCEMVLSCGNKLISCSCPAGPALEGMNISNGMSAESGAIESVSIEGDKISIQTIDNRPANGICGSGILSIVKELIRNEFIFKTGEFTKFDRFVVAKEPITIAVTQKDIRQIQLAKGAILSGILSILKYAGVEVSDIENVIIAGQFGAHLDDSLLVETGMIPKEFDGKLIYKGNTSKSGAYMALMSKKAKKDMETLSKDMEYLELANVSGYEDLFMECVNFPG